MNDPAFKLDDLLKLELHKFEEEVGEIVDRAQKEEKMEQALAKLRETWSRVEFQFIQFKDTQVFTVKLAEEDFEAMEDNQVRRPFSRLRASAWHSRHQPRGRPRPQQNLAAPAQHISPSPFPSLQVLVQGMMANRYMNTFRDDILGWNKKLMNVADVNQIMTEIQRTWAYLESLFIHSEEVKKELPEATVR